MFFKERDVLPGGMRRWHCSSYPACNVLSTWSSSRKRTAKYDTDMDGTTEADKRVAYMQMALEN
ncbi:minor tail protein [Salmonella sp. NCTC 11881]|nr:minor tail protein [Salmonella sp. NCTC 11881]